MSTTVSPRVAEAVEALRERLIDAVREADLSRLLNISAAIDPTPPPALIEVAESSSTVAYQNGEPVSVADVMARSDSADRAIAEGRTYTADEVLDYLKQRRSNATA